MRLSLLGLLLITTMHVKASKFFNLVLAADVYFQAFLSAANKGKSWWERFVCPPKGPFQVLLEFLNSEVLTYIEEASSNRVRT